MLNLFLLQNNYLFVFPAGAGTYVNIYKYDLEEEKFVPHQKIKTHSSTDVVYYNIQRNLAIEHFLLVANAVGGGNYFKITYTFVDLLKTF